MLDKDTVHGNFLKAYATFFYSVFKIILGQKASQKKNDKIFWNHTVFDLLKLSS